MAGPSGGSTCRATPPSARRHKIGLDVSTVGLRDLQVAVTVGQLNVWHGQGCRVETPAQRHERTSGARL